MAKIRSITTKKGDKGKTRLFSGEEVSKNSPRVRMCGDIDELVAVLGLARYHAEKAEIKESILFIQRSLFTVASEVATSEEKISRLAKRVDDEMLKMLDSRRDDMEKQVTLPNGFIVPGNSLSGAHLEHARTVARHCEREIVSLFENKVIKNELIIIWFNRLSDYLYLLARVEDNNPTPV